MAKLDLRKYGWASVPLVGCLVFLCFYGTLQTLVIGSCDEKNVCTQGAMDIGKVLTATPAPPANENMRSEQQQLATQYEMRLKWMFYTGTTLLVYVFLAVSCFLIMRRWCMSSSWSSSWPAVILFGSASLAVLLQWLAGQPLLDRLVRFMIDKAQQPPNLEAIISTSNGAGLGISVLIAATISVILFDKTADSVEIIAEKRRQLTFLLYFAAIALVIGLKRGDTLFDWSQAYMTKETSDAIVGLLGTITAVLGGFFTLFLATIYLPAIYILDKRAKKTLEATGLEDEAVQTKLQLLGFSFSYADALPKILAIAGPLLTGVISENLPKFF